LLSSFRSLAALAVASLTVLVFAAPAVAQEDTPVGGLQQLPTPNDCISTEPAVDPNPAECGTVISGGVTDADSIAVTPDGKHAYVAASGGENGGSLATFSRNLSTGELSFNACMRDPSSNEVCSTEVTQLDGATYVVATDNHVYVASADSGAVRGFTRNTTSGALTPIALPGGCVQATGAGGCTDGDNGLAGVQHLVLSPDGEFLYATSQSGDRIVVLDRNTSTGALSNASSVTEDGVRATDISPDGADLYAVVPSTDRLIHYNRDAGTGALTRAECFRDESIVIPPMDCAEEANGLNGAFDVVVVTTGAKSDVYVVSGNQGTDPLDMGSTLARFDRDTTTGDLTAQTCLDDNESAEDCDTAVNGIYDASSISARPDGAFLYVTGTGDDAIAYFSRSVTTGVVTQATPADEKCVSDGDAECGTDNDKTGLSGVNETAISPDGRFLYSTSPEDDAVAEFAIQYEPACPDITRDDVPAQTAVDITPICTDLNQPRDLLTIEVVAQPNAPTGGEGTVTAEDRNNDGRAETLEYDPGNFIGTTTFTYRAVDDQGNPSPAATVTVTVVATGAPVISVSDAGGSEGDGTMQFTFQRTGPTTETITVTYSTENDTAVAPGDYTSQTGQTVVFSPGETSETVNVAIADDNIDEVTERFRLRITNAVESAGPAPAIADDLGIGTIADNDTAIASIADAQVDEDGGPASLVVTLSNPSSRTVTVTYSTGGGTATASQDYEEPAESSSVSFTAGDTSESITIPIIDDDDVETTETFNVTLSGPTGDAQLGDATGQVTITDDEIPALSIGDAGIAEGDADTRNATFAVTLSSPTSSTVTVNWASANGTAVAGSDYDTASGVLTFAPGETTKTVAVPVRGDTTEEPDETFVVNLSGQTNATIADGSGAGTIQNDDRAPAEEPPTPPTPPAPPAPPARTTIVVGDTGLAEGNRGRRNVTFTIALSQAASSAIGVDVTTANGTALAGQDYLAGSGRVTFAPGETTKTVPVVVLGDGTPEADEQFTLRLSNATGADIVKAAGTATIANDDIRRLLPGLSFTVSPRRDLTLPHVFRVRGRVTLPTGVTTEDGCGTGRVSAQYKNGGNTISTRRTRLRDDCTFTIRTPFNIARRLRNARRLKLTVRFHGNTYLRARTARAVFVRVR
jgi:6-phosphogluconolactonase (cycloisomerase 2 family)